MRLAVRLMWIPMIIAALYTGWVLYQRHADATRPAPPPADPLAKYGSSVQILSFYAAPGAIGRGGKSLVCYGVVNAREVRLDPPVEKVWPSLSRCFDVHPAKTTQYTLTAEDAGHRIVSQTIEVAVR